MLENDSTRQMSFFDIVQPEFSERIRRVEHDGETYFSLVDIMAEFADSQQEARKYWNDTKKRLEADGFDVSEKIRRISMLDKTGVRKQKTDCANAETCLRIVQSIPSPKAEPIRQWLAHLGFERLEEARTPGLGSQRARQRDLALLQKQGYGEHEAAKRLETRIKGIDTFKSLMTTVAAICQAPNYGALVDSEYHHLFHETSSGLRALLNTKSIRDSLPSLQLSYLQTAEASLEMVIKHLDRLTMPQLLGISEQVIKPLGDHLASLSHMLGVHPVTGRPLIAASINR